MSPSPTLFGLSFCAKIPSRTAGLARRKRDSCCVRRAGPRRLRACEGVIGVWFAPCAEAASGGGRESRADRSLLPRSGTRMSQSRNSRTQELTLAGPKRDSGALAHLPKWPKDLRRLSPRLATRCVGERVVRDSECAVDPAAYAAKLSISRRPLVQKLTPRSRDGDRTFRVRRSAPRRPRCHRFPYHSRDARPRGVVRRRRDRRSVTS